MASLDRTLRKDLEKIVKLARRAAEAGARAAVEQLGVGEAETPKHLTTAQRALRNRLRAHGRQLGDRRDPKGAQATTRLVQECAYEQWHRMLFARFLAETDLLIEPESGVAITLDEVQELAREKATDWLPLASDYAERMLPQIFRRDDPVLEIALPMETRSEMEDLLKALTKPVFDADDSLGWVYQFWQADKKQEINDAEVKIGADELPAVTQLFTEDYMVLFLLHNTLGAWWAGKVLAGNAGLATSAPDEAALRAACKVGDIDWTYLRFVRGMVEDGTEGPWRPAAGAFDGWPKAAKDLTMLDPCMGSGHFLVFALPILVAFRMKEERLSQSAAVDVVLKDNLFGLEIDPRCTQIAAFNLAFAAWRKVGHRPLPQLNLACSGLAIGITKPEWLKLAEKVVTAADPAAKRDLLGIERNLLTVGLEERITNGLETLYDLFAKAPWLGSLIDPRRIGADIFREGFDRLGPLLSSTLAAADTDDARETAVAAQGIAKAADILGARYSLVVTNVPYLGRSKQDSVLQKFIEENFRLGQADLATAFVMRCAALCDDEGTSALVSPQNWLFLASFRSLREDLLKAKKWNLVARLGPKAFQTPMWDFNTQLGIISNAPPSEFDTFCGLDASAVSQPSQKAAMLGGDHAAGVSVVVQSDQVTNPGSIISFERLGRELLGQYASAVQGLTSGDNAQFMAKFWELPELSEIWMPLQSASSSIVGHDGHELALKWEAGRGSLIEILGQGVKGRPVWGQPGVLVRQISPFPAALYSGLPFEMSAAALIPQDPQHLPAILCFCQSTEFALCVRAIDQKLNATTATLTKLPFDLAHWLEVAARTYPSGLPEMYCDRPAQWLYHGHPIDAEPGTGLQVGCVRLLGYQWPAEGNPSIPIATASRTFGALINRCGLKDHGDVDGIVCLTALKGEPPAEQRLNALLADAFEADWSAARLATLLAEAGCSGKSLDDWLRDGFFEQHCELFQERPFVWHIWDGRRDGFHALLNYHRLAAPNGEGRRTLEKLIYSYLGDWIDRQRTDQTAGIEGADARLAHAEHLKVELVKILEGEPPYDIFVRWKPLHEQPIGWDPDINDGVRMNIRPFMAARTLNARGTNACILRATPKIKWDKDRGKEPTRDKADYPWFWGWDEAKGDFSGGASFDGNRWNDLHYSNAAKQATRDRRSAITGSKP